MRPQAAVAGGLAAALLLLLADGVLSWASLRSLVGAADAVARAQRVLAAAHDLQAEVNGAESARRAFVITGDETDAEAYRVAADSARRLLQELQRQLGPGDTRVGELARILEAKDAGLQASIALRRRDPAAVEAQAWATAAGRAHATEFRKVLDAVAAEQQAAAGARQEAARRNSRRAMVLVPAGAVMAALLMGGASVLLRREASRRSRTEDEARRREALYRRLLSHFPQGGVFLFDHDLRYVLVEGAGLADVGLSREAMEGRTIHELLPPETVADIEALYRAALAGTLSVRELPFADRTYSVHFVPIRDETGAVTHGLAVSLEITAERRAEREVLRLHRDLERTVAEMKAANEELEAFSYSVSHDLRAPLRHINGFVDLLQRGQKEKLDATGQRQLDTIARAARNMGQLIDDLLAFSRVSRTALRTQPVDLGFLVREMVQPLGLEAGGRAVEWAIGDLPAVMADPALLRVALDNLIGNAVKYSRTQPRPRIEIASTPGSDGEAVVHVRDNGVGFDMQYAGKLFGVFQRLHRADEFEGTGIGLATVRRIVHRHGGRTWAEGRPGQGATFYFTLPRADAAGRELTS